jgi:hypothetical protein
MMLRTIGWLGKRQFTMHFFVIFAIKQRTYPFKCVLLILLVLKYHFKPTVSVEQAIK